MVMTLKPFNILAWCELSASKDMQMSSERANLFPLATTDIPSTKLEKLWEILGDDLISTLFPRICYRWLSWGLQEISSVMPSTPDFLSHFLREMEVYAQTGIRSERHYKHLRKIHGKIRDNIVGWGAWPYLVDGFFYAHAPLENTILLDDVASSIYMARIEALKYTYCRENGYAYRLLLDVAILLKLQPLMSVIYLEHQQKIWEVVQEVLREHLLGRVVHRANLTLRESSLKTALQEGQDKLFDL